MFCLPNYIFINALTSAALCTFVVYDIQDHSHNHHTDPHSEVHLPVCVTGIPDNAYDPGQTAPDAGRNGTHDKDNSSPTGIPKTTYKTGDYIRLRRGKVSLTYRVFTLFRIHLWLKNMFLYRHAFFQPYRMNPQFFGSLYVLRAVVYKQCMLRLKAVFI